MRHPVLLLLSLGLLSACTTSGPIQIDKIEPQLVRMKHQEQVTIDFSNLPSHAELAVLPGGPYEKDNIVLPQRATQIELTKNNIWLHMADGTMGKIPLGQKSFQPVMKAVESFSTHDDELAIVADNTLQLYNEDLQQQFSLTLKPSHYQRISFNRSTICLVDERKQLNIINRTNKKSVRSQIKHEIKDIAAFDHSCVVLDENQGLYQYQVMADQIQMTQQYDLGNYAFDLQATDKQLVVAGGFNGVTALSKEGNNLTWSASYNKLKEIQKVDIDKELVIASDQNNAISLISLDHQGTARLISDYAFGDPITDLKIENKLAYVLVQDKLVMIDFSSMSSPALSYLGVNLGGTRRAFVEGDIIYVADWFSGLHLYDISIANAPRLISSLHTPGSSKGVLVHDNIAYIADDDHGLQIADVSDKNRPRLIAELPLSGLAYTMKLHGDKLFVASHRGGLHIVDVSNPHKPKLLGSYDTPGKSWAVHIKGKYAFVADDDSGVLVMDISKPDRIEVVANFTPGGHAEDIVIRDNLAYVAFFEQGLFILDVSNPLKIKQLSHLSTPGNARGIQLVGDLLYLASWKAGFHVIDIKDKANPHIIGQYDTKGSMWGLEVKDQILYGLDWWGGLKTFDVTDPTQPRLAGQYQSAGQIERMKKDKNFLYLAAGNRGLQVFDATNPLNPVWATGVELDGEANDIAIKGNTAYVSIKEKGIALIDISNPFQAHWIKTVPLAEGAELLALAGDSLLVAAKGGHPVLFDVSEPQQPQHRGSWGIKVSSLETNGSDIYAQTINGSLLKLNANKLTALVQFSSPTPIFVTSDKYLFSYSAITQQIEQRLLEQPTVIVKHTPFTAEPSGMAYADERLYVSVSQSGVYVVNFNRQKPAIEMHYPSVHNIKHPLVTQDAVFLAGEPIIVSGEKLPNIHTSRTGNRINLTIPANMPNGAYDLRIQAGQNTLFRHNAFSVGFKKPKKKKFTLEDLKRKMQQGNFEGKAP